MSRPAFSFFPDDWLNDLGLRKCSAATRGIWIDLICLAHQGEPYGHLRKSGEDLTIALMAARCTVTPRELARAIAELERNEVCSRSPEGTLYSRRMVRDEDIRRRRAAGGIRSLENPNVIRPKGTLKGPHDGIHLNGSTHVDVRELSVLSVKDSEVYEKWPLLADACFRHFQTTTMKDILIIANRCRSAWESVKKPKTSVPSDADCAEALEVAWNEKSAKQQGVGLFFYTVPAVIESRAMMGKPSERAKNSATNGVEMLTFTREQLEEMIRDPASEDVRAFAELELRNMGPA